MPRQQWTDKQERKYEHIKDSVEDRGASERRAKEIAARTINKERAQRGQSKTASRSSVQDMPSSKRGGQRSGTNRQKGRTREQLYNEARQMGIAGRSRMNKQQLERAVERRKAS
ncbi:MAG TPA: plasmid stabilization protein [Actinomycetota bacterium]|nr:plasmid stabilization protein [Actinomycetota bacterium]